MIEPQHGVISGDIAPVLIVPRVFDAALCGALISYFEQTGGRRSGAMYDEGGVTVERFDDRYKIRRDCVVIDQALAQAMDRRFIDMLKPAIKAAFLVDITRVERRLIARYDGDVGGHFSPHRDNTTKGTAHRQFACTINLNTDDYDGGALRFPDFGGAVYRCSSGDALVFSCSLVHEALPVTRGRRYAALPFFHDEASARLREQNLRFLAPGSGARDA